MAPITTTIEFLADCRKTIPMTTKVAFGDEPQNLQSSNRNFILLEYPVKSKTELDDSKTKKNTKEIEVFWAGNEWYWECYFFSVWRGYYYAENAG